MFGKNLQPAVPPISAPRPPNASQYLRTPTDLSSVGSLLPPTRSARFPAASDVDTLGLTTLAAAIRDHARAVSELHSAAQRYAEATPPNGAAWRAAVTQAGVRVRDGQDDAGGPVRRILDGRSERVADAVCAAHIVNVCFDRVLTEAQRADPAVAEHALDQWIEWAAKSVRDGAQRGDRALLATVEQEQSSVYPKRRALWSWLSCDGSAPFQPTPGGVAEPLAEAIVEHAEAVGHLMNNQGLYSQSAVQQLLPSGSGQYR